MSKKVSIPTSVEAQIRTRARNLPIHKCFISKDWEIAQMATITITRKHTNGNLTIGCFLVDLKLRGVKDCTYKFNESSHFLDDITKEHPAMHEECDYNLAHNVIYAGLEFARDYGFEPHRNFKTAQYILEEDSDDIPLIDIPLGDDGIPVLELRPGESGQREMAILNKTASGNYHVVVLKEDGTPEYEDLTYDELMDEIIKIGADAFFEKYGKSSESKLPFQVFVDVTYMIKVYTEEDKLQIDTEFDNIIKDPRLLLLPEHVNSYEEEFAQAFKYFCEDKIDEARVETRKIINKYPDDPYIWDLYLYNLSVYSDDVDEEAVKEAYSLFPNNPSIKAWYAEWLAENERPDDIFVLFDNKTGLDALTTENEPIRENALVAFIFAYATAWLDKGDILRAEPYYQLILRLDLDFRLSDHILETMNYLKVKKLQEMLDAGAFGD